MNKIIECIPNFSEGKRQDVIDAISNAANSVPGAKLINVNVDPSYNRCVHTIVGEPEAVLEATFRACQVAVEKIDMNCHHGEHPRIGAIDASPIVPVENVTIEECVEYANRLGERIFRELEVPVYLYEKAAKKEERIKLQNIRHPEYEGLQQLITQPEWLPDYGEAKLHPTAGAMPLGVRGPLVAFNISLNTTDVKIAKKIAQCIREAKGAFAEARAIGVFVEEKQCVQVSCMINHKIVPLYRIIELVRMEARRYGLSIIGTEVCGMISKEALMDSCAYYMQLEGFDPKAQILEDQL
ncbi:MAG: glutamate formimidoyltransferase [Burkholderiales bacterium]|mgnify:FL=1|uniref:glutamate formimidoyltransferase n=1 Tax=uncultured Turicimonas sp. TaxID=1918607 RepID=UPI001ED52679|nr:glutamate formimidoyltransferase [uncultured Turicimonas sp.]MBS4845277.1 glutamate formimidoyltransferase [Burkholderiales bacterium]